VIRVSRATSRYVRASRGFVAADGGYAEYVSLPAESVVKHPDAIDPVAATAVSGAIAEVTSRADADHILAENAPDLLS